MRQNIYGPFLYEAINLAATTKTKDIYMTRKGQVNNWCHDFFLERKGNWKLKMQLLESSTIEPTLKFIGLYG